jgi:Flp pilus assembly protein TadD
MAARPRLAATAAVALAAVLPFLGSLENPPILDDGWTALSNPLVWSLRNVGRIFTNLYGYAGTPSVRGPYRPLTTLSFALDWAVHRDWLPGFHAVNIALHALASVLVAALALHLARAGGHGRPRTLSLLAGLVFALHPAHVEAVVTLYGRTEPLSACFALGALLLALTSRGTSHGACRPAPPAEPSGPHPGFAGPCAVLAALRLRAAAPRRRGNAPPPGFAGALLPVRWPRILAAVLVLAAGILSKEMAVMVPALFLLVAAALPAAAGLEERPGFRTPAGRRALFRALTTAAALSLAFLPYLAGHGTSLAVAPVARWFPVGTPPWRIALTMSRVLGEYLRILVFPSFLGGDFAYAARIPTLAAPTAGFAAATLAWAFALAAGIVLLRRAPLPGIGITWIFVALLPVLQIVPVGVLIAERLLYLPSAGFSIAAGWALAKVLPERAGPDQRSSPAHRLRTARAAAVGLVLAALCARTVLRTRDWTSELAFWRSELAKAPHEVVVNNNLALAYLALGEPAQAVPRLETALAVNPGYWRAWVNLGIARGRLGERGAALHAFQEAARLAPDESDPPRFLGRILHEQGDLEGAIEALREARRKAPEQAVLARELAGLLLEAGRAGEARAALQDAVRLDPGDEASRRKVAELGP